jgi:hypothetical protein
MVDEKKLNDIIGIYAEELLPLLTKSLRNRREFIDQLSPDGTIAVSNCLAAIGMYRSTKRLKKLTKVLVGLTVVLALLTVALLLWSALQKRG